MLLLSMYAAYRKIETAPHMCHICAYVTGFGKIRLNAANNFFQYHRIKPYGSIFFEKLFMAEMDRHQLALAYDAVVSSGVL